MEKEVRITITDYGVTTGDDDGRAVAWEAGLPDAADLPPLSQFLISPELASAFNISPEPHRSMTDVTRASHKTLSTLRLHPKHHPLDKVNDNYDDNDYDYDKDNRSCSDDDDKAEEMVVEGEETVDLTPEGSDSRKLRRVDSGGSDESSVKTSKRSRLVWTPELHRRFVEVVAHLGVKNAVPKTIMQLMNVEGLTRENVASHLQKYRLYVKRMQGLSNEGSSDSDHVFGSTAVSRVPIPVKYPPEMVNMPYATPSSGGREYYHGFGYQSQYSHPSSMMMQPKDWYVNNFGFVTRYQHDMSSNEN